MQTKLPQREQTPASGRDGCFGHGCSGIPVIRTPPRPWRMPPSTGQSLMPEEGYARQHRWFPIPSMIAPADRLVIRMDGSGAPIADVTWADALSVVADHLQRVSDYQTRYRTEGHPSGAELDQL